MRQCERCGTDFEPTNYDRGGYQRFCSDRCNRLSKGARTYKRKHEERIAALKCRQCDGQIAGRVKQFCSSKCRSDWHNANAQTVLVTRSCQCCYGIFVIDKHYRDRYCSQFCRGFMQEVWPRPVKRKPSDAHPLGLICDECDLPQWAQGKCSKHYSAMRMANGQRPRYPYVCEVCHLNGESYTKSSRMHPACSARTSLKPLVMSRSTELAVIETRRYLARPVNVLPKGQIMFAGTCWNCGAQWVDYILRHSCSDKCRKALHQAASRRARLTRKNKNEEQGLSRGHGKKGHRSRARKYGVDYHPGITDLSIFEASGWVCQLCFGFADPREKTGLWMPTLDHIIPMARGGAHVRENLQLAHMICNSYKGDRTGSGM